jgi:UDP-N-acetylmuramyl pentapeptide synthase
MVKISSSDIAGIINGKLSGPSHLLVTEVVTDSRQLSYTEGLVFFALSGINHDGHQFIDNLYQKGIRIFVVERIPENPGRFTGAAFIETSNTVEALHLLASFKRNAFKSPVIAVTGSAGKTIVKEWLADILGLTTAVVRSPKFSDWSTSVSLETGRKI